jgi:hypothetical protein
MNPNRHLKVFGALLVTAGVAVAWSSDARAALLAEETFSSYPAGSNLAGANGGTGWSDAWAVGASQDYLNQVRNNVFSFGPYPGYTPSTTPAESQGNYLNLAAGFGGPSFNYAERFLDTSGGGTFGSAGLLTTNSASQTAIGADGTTVWGSLLYQNNGQFWLRNPGVVDNQFPLPNSGGDGTVALALYRIDYASGPDTLSLWINPDLSTWTPSSTPTSTATGDFAFNKFIWVESANDSENRVDDIRFGTTAADVVPVNTAIPEPVTAASLGVVGLAMGLRRRR